MVNMQRNHSHYQGMINMQTIGSHYQGMLNMQRNRSHYHGMVKRRIWLFVGAIQLTLVMNLIALASFGVFFCLGCDNVRIAGVTEAYHNGFVWTFHRQ